MRGQVETPDAVVDKMVSYLFGRLVPEPGHRVLDAGCGRGTFIDGVIRWCRSRNHPLPRIIGVEQDHQVADRARSRFREFSRVEVVTGDYLSFCVDEPFDFIMGNPPYVGLTGMEPEERQHLKRRFESARGRFDLYMLFMEHGLSQLRDDGRLIYVTPEKWIYVDSAARLREIVGECQVELLEFLPADAFPGRITYPLITMIRKRAPRRATRVIANGDRTRRVRLAGAGSSSWLGRINGTWAAPKDMIPLSDVCARVSVGIATGADGIFCMPRDRLPEGLEQFSKPAVAGRDLDIDQGGVLEVTAINDVMLVPYGDDGQLMPEDELGALGRYLRRDEISARLVARTCAMRKPWYAFHDSFNPEALLSPKLLCKDICSRPVFWIDETGQVVPRHSVYYVIPRDPDLLYPLAEWLNNDTSAEWLFRNAQRAANDYLRLQAGVLRRLPVPRRFLE